MRQIKIAWCSKRHHAEKIKATRPDGFHYVSRWLDTANLAENAAKPAHHWMEENFSDIRDSDYVFVLAETGETLKWALGEVGWAMAYGRPVIVIGDHDSYRPWRGNSTRVRMVPTIDAALKAVKAENAPKLEVLNSKGETVEARS